ncbi:MAG: RNA-binding protein [Spirochaetaceae bacterium]|jgi:RNA recognition motif-containing protein|nr:RNA-binding protein [Spirochaetaceae bacterium]
MSTNIYVGNMSFNAHENDLQDLFAQYGEVSSVRIISDRDTGRSKGFGFVVMEDSSAAEAAISSLNESEWLDRKIVVNVARERTQRF